MPPTVLVVSPGDGSHFSGEWAEIVYSVRSPSGHPIDRVDITADGKLYEVTGLEETASGEAEGRAMVKMPRKDTVVFLIAQSGHLDKVHQ